MLGYAPDRVDAPGEALDRRSSARTIRTRRSARTASARRSHWFARSASPADRCPATLRGELPAQPAAADAPSACRARPRSCPATMAAGDLRAARAGRASSGFRALKDFYPGAAGRQPGARRLPGRRGRGARRARRSPERPRRRQRARRSPARSTTPASARAGRRELAARLRAAASASRSRRCSAWRDPHAVVERRSQRRGSGAPVVRDPDAAAVGARACACTRSCATRCARAGRPAGPRRRGRRRARRRRPRHGVRASASPPARASAAAPTGSCSRPAASPRAGSSSTRDWRAARGRRSACRWPACPAGERALRARLLRRRSPMARAGVAVDARLRPVDPAASASATNVLVARRDRSPAPSPWREKSGEGISLATGYARELVPASTAAAAGGGSETDATATATTCSDADARLARPLRQVHDLRDVLPGRRRHAALPGAEVRRPAGRALPRAREPSADASLDYCSGCGICTQVCPQGVHIAEINSQARARAQGGEGVPLRDRLIARPTLAGRLGTPVAPLANWTLRNRSAAAAREKALGIHRDAPMPRFAGRDLPALGPKRRAGTRPAAAQRRSSSSTAAAPTTTSRGSGEMAVAGARAQRLRGERPQAGLLRAAAAVQRPLRRRARGYVRRARGAARALRARRASTSSAPPPSCTLMLKREALRDPRACDDDDLRVVAERMFDICEYLRDAARARRAAHRLRAGAR